ncbi:MAG: GNAT family N-acetyltransferase, partial [Acidithiobacillus sp.]|uniref:GNAT family N-acetyltransferase n=1 Tax=Acidithiobacillus sp. TaxID=1872118 RepID=UPI003D047CC4
LPESVWDALGTEVSHALSPRFWRVLEASDLQGFSYRYALLRDENGAPVAFWGLYTVTTDIAIFAPRFLRTLLNRIRRYFPRFLIWNMLECGTPITIVSPPLAQRGDWEFGTLVRQWTQTMAEEARRARSLLIVLRDFEPNAWDYRPELARHGYHWIDGLPNTYLDIPWSDPEGYRAAMRSYYRSKLLKHRRKVEAAGIRYELREDFADMAEELCAQWREVHEHAKEFQREVLTPAFYREFSRQMGPDSLVLLYYQNDTLLAHALLMRDGTMVRWLYVGRARAQNDGLYLYIAATVVETAIELGAKRLEMGLTTYDVKLDLGAKAVPIAMGLRARWSWMNPFVGWGYRLLNSVPKPRARAVFKDSQATQGNAS